MLSCSSGDLKNDFLNITAVHTLKVEAVQELINKTESNWETVAELIAENKIIVSEYNGENTIYANKVVYVIINSKLKMR